LRRHAYFQKNEQYIYIASFLLKLHPWLSRKSGDVHGAAAKEIGINASVTSNGFGIEGRQGDRSAHIITYQLDINDASSLNSSSSASEDGNSSKLQRSLSRLSVVVGINIQLCD